MAHPAHGVRLVREEAAATHAGVDVQVHPRRAAAPTGELVEVLRGVERAHLLLDVEVGQRLLELLGECRAQTQDGKLRELAADDPRLGVGADPDRVGAGLGRDPRQRLEPVPVGVGLHHDAQARRRDVVLQQYSQWSKSR